MGPLNNPRQRNPPGRPPPPPLPPPLEVEPEIVPEIDPPGAGSRLRAELAIRWMRLAGWVRRHKLLVAVVAAVLVLGAAGGVYVAKEGLPDLDLQRAATPSAGDAGAAGRRELGHQQWAARHHRRAIRSYAEALSMDASVADDRMVANLVAAIGTGERQEAQSVIAKHKLVQAERGLERLLSSHNRNVRWAAARTLDKIGKSTKQGWETVLLLDLKSEDCEVRREAVERLGVVGTRRVLPALQSAAEDDKKTSGWFKSGCLGDRIKDAQQKVQARK